MEQIKIPDGYQSSLNLHDTQIAIKTVKDFFQQTLAQKLNLLRVSAPVFVNPSSGLNDNLNGVERPVSFDIKGQPENAEIVHSLAKWKRYALQKYGFAHGEGLYTDMIAIRRDEDLDNIHSVYVDQWDWEKIISKEERNMDTLVSTVRAIYSVLRKTEKYSTFKRPEGYFAGKLVQDAGLKGKTIGGAQVSEKHSGFLINIGGATAQDILDLIAFCQKEVKDKFGVTLETEVKIVGEE